MLEINLVDIKSQFFCEAKEIKNFGVSFDLNENFSFLDIEKTKITISYLVKLYENKNSEFGNISAIFEFNINENINYITLNDETKRRTLLFCLKSNHNNINDLILNELKINNFTLIEENTKNKNIMLS